MGHSYGGRVIIKLASRPEIPFKIGRIVLMDSAGILPKKTKKQKRKIRRYKMVKKDCKHETGLQTLPQPGG